MTLDWCLIHLYPGGQRWSFCFVFCHRLSCKWPVGLYLVLLYSSFEIMFNIWCKDKVQEPHLWRECLMWNKPTKQIMLNFTHMWQRKRFWLNWNQETGFFTSAVLWETEPKRQNLHVSKESLQNRANESCGYLAVNTVLHTHHMRCMWCLPLHFFPSSDVLNFISALQMNQAVYFSNVQDSTFVFAVIIFALFLVVYLAVLGLYFWAAP